MGKYCLYQGNLSINENEEAALWLIEKVFADIEIPLIIAGKNPSQNIIAAANLKDNISIIGNPSEIEMEELITNAQLNLLPSFSNTGIKLKLLHALFCGRHCIVNNMMVEGTGLENICRIAENEIEFRKQILLFFQQPFTEEQLFDRQQLLKEIYNNKENAKQLIAMIYNK